jgi:hypothetical protein
MEAGENEKQIGIIQDTENGQKCMVYLDPAGIHNIFTIGLR